MKKIKVKWTDIDSNVVDNHSNGMQLVKKELNGVKRQSTAAESSRVEADAISRCGRREGYQFI